MKNEPIAIMRGVFDPGHRGHLDAIVSSFRFLSISKLQVVAKFIGEKDPAASVEQRIDMMKLQTRDYGLPVEIIRQDVRGHVAQLIDLERQTGKRAINICGSDKIIREMKVYGQRGDTFGIAYRDGYKAEDAHVVARERGINLIAINPDFSTSSTLVRGLIAKDQLEQEGLDQRVSQYIAENRLYIHDESTDRQQSFIEQWNIWLAKMSQAFPSLQLSTISPPKFNPIQHKSAWIEKYIRTVLKVINLEDDQIIKFVSKAENT